MADAPQTERVYATPGQSMVYHHDRRCEHIAVADDAAELDIGPTDSIRTLRSPCKTCFRAEGSRG